MVFQAVPEKLSVLTEARRIRLLDVDLKCEAK